MKTEAECVHRNDGKNCDRDCGKCDLLRDASEILEAYTVVIAAAEKQIAKTPRYTGQEYDGEKMDYEWWSCPNCGTSYQIGIHTYDFCHDCGQHIQHEDLERD